MSLDDLINEATQKAFGLRAVKAVDLLAVTVGNDSGKPANLMSSGNLHVLVGIDHAENKLAVIVNDQFVQQRRQHSAWRAPICTNINQNRHFVRAGHDKLIEVNFFYIARKVTQEQLLQKFN